MNRLLADLLAEAVDDWVALVDASGVVGETAAGEVLQSDPAELRAATLRLLDTAISEGLLETGDVTEGGFQPWPVAAGEASARLRQIWPSEADDRSWFYGAWFAITDRGRQVLEP